MAEHEKDINTMGATIGTLDTEIAELKASVAKLLAFASNVNEACFYEVENGGEDRRLVAATPCGAMTTAAGEDPSNSISISFAVKTPACNALAAATAVAMTAATQL